MDSTEKLARMLMPSELVVERILQVVTVLGLVCLCIGLPLFVAGRALNNSIGARVGAYMFLIGIMFLVTRLLFWIIEERVGRGLESMMK